MMDDKSDFDKSVLTETLKLDEKITASEVYQSNTVESKSPDCEPPIDEAWSCLPVVMASEEMLLSELCSICHINLPQYRCPRCSLRSCSLKCVQRHKVWSQCTGVRDPSTYVKRADLGTAAGIDHDFNFLVGIERELENAEREAEKRGLDLKLRDERQRHRLQKGEVNVKGAIERGKVILDLAPKGMHRQVVNKTHWSKAQKCLVWTIEWIDEHGDKTLHLALETTSVQKAHAQMLLEAARSSRKRKYDTDAAGHQGTIPEPRSKHSLDEGNGKNASSTDSVPPSSENLSSSDTYFYLLRPRTPANIRVLAPISAETSITDCLKERVLLEFPTIYVLPFKPDSLPAGFMTEVAFLSQSSADSPTKEAVDHDPEQSTAAADEVVQCGVSQTPVVEV